MAEYLPTMKERLLPDFGQNSDAPAVQDRLRAGASIPENLKTRMQRGRRLMMNDAPRRRICHKFERGETYWRLNDKTQLVQVQPGNSVTLASAGGKPTHRISNQYNFIRPLVDSKVSAATSKIPSYDVAPTTTSPKDIAAANIAQKVSLFGYDKWGIRDASRRAVKNAVVSGDAYAWPYFDPNVGPYKPVNGQWVGNGEIKILILNGNQVYSEPGVPFEDSPWFCIERAMPIDQVQYYPGYDPRVKLRPDGSTTDNPNNRSDSENMVVLTCYFERPCPKYPRGRYFCVANDRVIVPETDYPLEDANGVILDEPCIHRLKWVTDPDSDHDLGLVWQLLDFQRTIQDCYNKLLEWKNRTLNPQMMAPENSLSEDMRRNDIPGYIYTYKPIGNLKPEWETPNTNFVAPLQEILNQAKQDMLYVAADQDLSAILAPNVASSSIQASIDQAQSRWGAFLSELAEWHSRVMRHCLLLTSVYYNEPRLIQIRGERGVENINDFLGSNLLDQVNVTVNASSLEAKTHTAIMQEVFGYFDRQMISPQQAMTAISSRDMSVLTYSHDLDVARANNIIQRILQGTAMQMPPKEVVDPQSGQILTVPGWMPGPGDDADAWEQIFSDFTKTDAYENLDPPRQEMVNLIYSAIVQQQIAKANLKAQLQMQTAQNLGMANAAKPQTPGGTPSTPDAAGGTPPPQQ